MIQAHGRSSWCSKLVDVCDLNAVWVIHSQDGLHGAVGERPLLLGSCGPGCWLLHVCTFSQGGFSVPVAWELAPLTAVDCFMTKSVSHSLHEKCVTTPQRGRKLVAPLRTKVAKYF